MVVESINTKDVGIINKSNEDDSEGEADQDYSPEELKIRKTIKAAEKEGWILVRQIPEQEEWHPATDQLKGTD